jgi:hypothetical protein
MFFRFPWVAFIGLFLIAACVGRPPVGEYGIPCCKAEELFPEPELRKLADASCSGNKRRIETSIQGGVDPEARGKYNKTALLWALHCRSLRGVEALLENGAEPEQRAVRAAAHIGNPAFLEAVLKAGGNPNHYETFSEAIYTMGNRYNDWRHYDLLFAYGAEVGKTKILNMLITANEYCRAKALLDKGYDYDLPASLRHLNKFIHSENPDIRSKPCFSDLEARLVEAVD